MEKNKVKQMFETELLIELVKSQPPLYNSTLRVYRCKGVTDKLWKEIGDVMEKDVAECRTVWASLRSSFARHLQNIKKNEEGTNVKKRKPWYLADKMSFLLEYMQQVPMDQKTRRKSTNDKNNSLDFDENSASLSNFECRSYNYEMVDTISNKSENSSEVTLSIHEEALGNSNEAEKEPIINTYDLVEVNEAENAYPSVEKFEGESFDLTVDNEPENEDTLQITEKTENNSYELMEENEAEGPFPIDENPTDADETEKNFQNLKPENPEPAAAGSYEPIENESNIVDPAPSDENIASKKCQEELIERDQQILASHHRNKERKRKPEKIRVSKRYKMSPSEPIYSSKEEIFRAREASNLMFFQSILFDLRKLSDRKLRFFKQDVLNDLNKYIDQDDDEYAD